MSDHYCDGCDRVTYECRCSQDICSDCGDAAQWDSEKLACSCSIWALVPEFEERHPVFEDQAFLQIALSTRLADHQHPDYDCGHLDSPPAPIDPSRCRSHCLVCGQIVQGPEA